MKFKRFLSGPPISPYAPQWDFRVGTSTCEDIDTNSLSKFLLSKEKDVKKLPTTVMTHYLMDILTWFEIQESGIILVKIKIKHC